MIRRLKARDYVNASQNQSIINKIPYFNHFKRANNSLQISSKFISNKDHTFRHEFNEDNMLLNCTETNFQNTRNEHLDTQIQNDSIFFQNNVRLANLNDEFYERSKLGRTFTLSSKRAPFKINTSDYQSFPKVEKIIRQENQIKRWKEHRMKVVKDALFKTMITEWQLKNKANHNLSTSYIIDKE